MLNNEILQNYKDLKRYYKIINILKEVIKNINLNDLNDKYINELILDIKNYINHLNNIIHNKEQNFNLKNINLSIDDILKLSLID